MARPKHKQHNRKPGKHVNNLSWVSYFIGSVLLFGAIIGAIIVFILSRNLPSLEMLEKYEPNLVTQVYSSDGRLIAEFGEEKRKLVSIDKIPKPLIDAFVAIEDQRFWNHWGVNIYRVPFAAIKNILTMDYTQGFSTLTMQLARGLYLTPEKKLIRKIKETLTAIQIERTYTKREIMEMFLNNTFFGYKIYGIASAAQVYFNKDVSALTLEESALLAGILPAPNRYSPERNPDKAKIRRDLVLKNMYKEKYITEKQYDAAVKTPLKVVMRSPEYRGFASYFTEYIRIFLEENKDKIGADYMTDGLKIFTTLDRRLQGIAEKAINDKLREHQARANRLYRNNKSGISKIVQGALICIEPGTGYIRAMVGGRNFKESQFNRAVQAKRQPGSAFKPFVWATAIDNGYKVTDTILNQYVTLFMADGSRWTPQNFDLSVGGPTTLREGLRRSLNLISVRLVQQKWAPAKQIAFLAQKLGISTEIRPYDAIALGTSEVLPIDITSAFAVFANMGIRVEPGSIIRIEDRNGKIIWQNRPNKREVLSQETAYLMVSLLETVVQRGTGASIRSAYKFLRPAGGKTGTTQNFTDAWFVGFTPQLATGVWIGFDDQNLTLGDRQTGAVAALPVWANFMKAAHDTLHLPVVGFPRPDGIEELDVCQDSGELATSYCPRVIREVFNRKYKPENSCHLHSGKIGR